MKKTVDEVVDKLEELAVVRECYDQWCRLRGEVEGYYHDKPRERKKLSQEKGFRQIKNAVIQEAEHIRLGEISFEDDDLAEHDEPEPARHESNACRELWRIIRNEDISLDYRDRAAEKLEQVAERGDAHAQYRMGQLYRDGPLLIPDNRKAKHWLTQAAKQGLRKHKYALGKLLLSDDWEVRDPDEGHPLAKTGGGKRKPLCCLPSGQRVSGGERCQQGHHQSGGLVHQIGGGGKPVRSVHAGKAVPDGTGAATGSGPGNGVVQPPARQGKPVCSVLGGAGTPPPPPL